ncbi:class I SAM-dependent methyltransferase [Actinomadura gamaensis]|uniref:Class I SAM-dependent methyltransferase n=1 Tax=Actinomadura gamaensis TaxID=1763541 RepID=A0ABV9U118_9ACTN
MDASDYKGRVAEAFHSAAPTYDRAGVEFFTPMGRRLAALAAPREGERVLDVGCGRGACLFPAAEAVGGSGRAVGIDIAPAMVDAVRREAAERGLAQVEAALMDAEHPEFDERAFDLVVGSFSIIFLAAAEVLPRYARLLVPGGRLAFSSPLFTEDVVPFMPPALEDVLTDDIVAAVPEEWRPRQAARRMCGWLYEEADIARTLRAAGFGRVRVVDEAAPMEIASGRDYVAWSHTQGMRLFWQWLPPGRARELTGRMVAAVEAARDADGRIRVDMPVRYVLAERTSD